MLRKTFHSFIKIRCYSEYTHSVLKTSIKSCVYRSFHQDNVNILWKPIVSGSIERRNNGEKMERNVSSLQTSNTYTLLRKTKSLEELMKYLENNPNLDESLYLPIFRKIHTLAKKSKFDKQQFIQNPVFVKFCNNVNKSVPLMKSSCIIEITKTLVFLNVSSDSYLIQNLLTVLSKYVNELNLRQIFFLLRLFKDSPDSLILNTLKSVLVLVFDSNVGTRLNTNNPDAVLEALSVASMHKLSVKSRAHIVNAAFNLKEQFSFGQCVNTVITLCNMRSLDDERRALYSFCLEKVNSQMKEFANFHTISAITASIIDAFLFGDDSFFYDETFLLNAVNYLTENNLGLREAGILMRSLNKISFQNQKLLDYTSGLISNTNFDTVTPMSIVSFVVACSDASYKPKEWARYEEDLIQFFLKNDVVTIILYNVITNLIVLDCWPVKLIEKVFDENFINQWFKQIISRTSCAHLLSVYRAVKTLIPYDYNGPLPSTLVIEKCKKALIPEDEKIHIRHALVKLLHDDESLVLDRVMTELGHYLDHVIIISKDGKPQPINFSNDVNDRKCKIHSFNELKFPQDSFIVGVILLPASYYCIDGIRLRGKIKLNLNSLSKTGVVPLPVSLNIWECLKDDEKLPYLRKELQAKVFLDN